MLLQAIENQIFRKAAPIAVHYLSKPDLKTNNPLARKTLEQAAREFQVAPPVTIHSSDPLLMAGVWSATREVYVINQNGRAMREAVASAVSTLNECPYCVTIHTSLFSSTGGNAKHLAAPEGLPSDIFAAHGWALAKLNPESKSLQFPDIENADVPQIFGTAVIYHYINRMVSVFLGETPVALPGMKSSLGQKMMRTSFAFFGRRFANLDPDPGQFILDQDPELPPEFKWATDAPFVAKALAQFAWAAEQAGRNAVDKDIRSLVLNHLSDWQGESVPLSRIWIEELVASLTDDKKPAARLALLVAWAAWQVDETLITEFKQQEPPEKILLQTVAWASFAASRKIASWFLTGSKDGGKYYA